MQKITQLHREMFNAVNEEGKVSYMTHFHTNICVGCLWFLVFFSVLPEFPIVKYVFYMNTESLK